MRKRSIMIVLLAGEEASAILAILDDYRGESGIIGANGTGNDTTHPVLSFLAEGLANAGRLTLRSDFLFIVPKHGEHSARRADF